MSKRLLILLALLVVLFASCDKRLSKLRRKNLNGARIALLAGSMQEKRAMDTWPKGIYHSYPTNEEALKALAKGEVDAAYLDELVMYNKNYRKDQFELAFIDNDRMPIAGAFRKEDTELAEEFTRFIRKMKSNGQLVRMKNRWTMTERIDTITPASLSYGFSRVCKPFVIGIIGEMRPYSIQNDGQWTGFENELWECFAAYIGCQAQFEVYDFEDLLTPLYNHEVDVIAAAITVTEEREKKVLFSEPYSYSCSVCLVRK